jgi:hypothetical protein
VPAQGGTGALDFSGPNTTTRFVMKGRVVMFSYPEAQDDELIMEAFAAAGAQFKRRSFRRSTETNRDAMRSVET